MRSWLAGLFSALFVLPLAAHADVVTYDFVWTGNGGFMMKGFFLFDSPSAGDGAVRDSEVLSLFFEGFVDGSSFASNAIAPSQEGFNFNFNAVAGEFFQGGLATSDSGQIWGLQFSGLGFLAGLSSSNISLGGIGLGSAVNPVPLVATLRATEVPEPRTWALVGLSLAALGIQSLSRKKA